MKNTYDLVLIGARFPQLALGALLSKRGHSVLIVDQHRHPAPFTEEPIDGYLFRRRPAPLSGLDSDGFLGHFLNEIGIGRVLVSKSYPSNPVSYQVVLPRHRINVYQKREYLLEEISREFPHYIDPFREVYSQMDALTEKWFENFSSISSLESIRYSLAGFREQTSGIRQTRQLKPVLKQFEGTGSEADFLNVQSHILGGCPVNGLPGTLSAALIHRIGRRGTFQEPVGTTSLTDLMLTRFQEFGGEILSGRAMDIKNIPGSKMSIILEDGSNVEASCLSTTSDIAKHIKGLVRKSNTKTHRDSSARVPVRFYLGIDEAVIPLGMEDNLFLLREDEGGPLGIKILYLALSPAGSSMSPEGRRSLTVTALVEKKILETLNDEMIQEAEQDILIPLETVIPFLHDGLNLFKSDLADSTGEKAPRPLRGEIMSWIPALVGRGRIWTLRRGRVAVMTLPPWELGLEGETLSAIAAAGSMRKHLEKGK